MKVEHYINVQQDFNQALQFKHVRREDYALFHAMFAERLEFEREHVQDQIQGGAQSLFDELIRNTNATIRTKACDADYACTSHISASMQQSRMHDAKWLLCSQPTPLSIYDDATRINEDVLENCSVHTQQAFKQAQQDDYLGEDVREDGEVLPDLSLLNDVIEASQAYSM
ncbi:hypothetical protein KJ365_13750 [Glaciecola sp. XM2]|jgi:hypothetical protein|uniref:VC2046/SO_2500 family protein n=1 Tax=Glaciecola sp. XM2 TaxID=1914931 RepID=UPI001BDED89E|nr:VC2046/SO_2500 family protein [Glaciecola sp. XM2]MBT1451952.1 hypothetical protein [Glaciecola sp. XM2]